MDPIEQNNKEAAAFSGDFSASVQSARENEAVSFMQGFIANENPPAQDPQEGALQKTSAIRQGLEKSGEALKRSGDSVAQDVSLGVLHAPRSMARGAIDAVNSLLEIGDGINDALGMPELQIFNPEGKIDIDLLSQNEVKARFDRVRELAKQRGEEAPADESFSLGNIDKPKTQTLTGDAIETLTQFAVGLKGVDKGLKALKVAKASTRGGQFAGNVGKGALADVLAFDEHEERLSNILTQVPALEPVAQYLAADEDDGFLEGKAKQAIEGLTLGALGDLLFEGARYIKRGKKAAAGVKPDDLFDMPKEEAAGVGINADNFEFLGKADSEDLLSLRQQKLDDAMAEVEGAFGKPKQVAKNAAPSIDDYEINFARIDGPDDIKRLMDEMVNKPELKPSIEAARRGTRDTRETLTAATDIDGFDGLMERRVGDAFNAEQIVAARKVYYDTTAKLMEAAKRAASAESTDIDQFNFRRLVATHHAVQKEFMGVRAEAGRALQAWSIPVGGTSSENVRALEQVLNEFGGANASKELAQRIAAKGNRLNTSQLNAITQKAALARTTDAMTEIWTLGLLTNPVTHVVNVSSNVLTGLTLGAERFASAFAKDSPVSLREGAEFFTAYLENQKLAFKNGAEAFRTGQTGIGMSKLDLPRVRLSARDVLDPEGKAGILSKGMDAYGAVLNRYAGGMLAFGDEYAKTLLYQSQVRALAVRQGVAQGLSGDALKKHIAEVMLDPPASLRADAVEFANYGTFTNELGKMGQDVQRWTSRMPALRFLVPFVRTPANIFKFTFARTPLGLASQKIRDDVAAGGVRRATALSRIGLGTSIMAIGADLSQNGTITGAGPSDPKIRSGLRRTGWQPYSIKIGDTYYSYARFEPVATILGMSADLAEILSNYESYDVDAQQTIESLGTAAVVAVSNQAVGKTFLSGFADTIQMLSDPGRYGQGYLQRFAGSFVPAGSAAIERAVNPEMEYVFTYMDAIKRRIPGASEDVPKRRNIWGEEIQYFYPNEKDIIGSTAERIMSLFNPVYYSAEKDSPVDAWMLQNGFSINMPQKIQDFDGVRVDLRDHPEIYSRLVELRGNGTRLLRYGNQTMKEFFTSLATEEDPYGRHVGFFMDLGGNSYDDQQNFISQVVRDYQKAAKEQVFDEFDELPGLVTQGRQKEELLNKVRGPLQEGGE